MAVVPDDDFDYSVMILQRGLFATPPSDYREETIARGYQTAIEHHQELLSSAAVVMCNRALPIYATCMQPENEKHFAYPLVD
jgi:hypothetical protein